MSINRDGDACFLLFIDIQAADHLVLDAAAQQQSENLRLETI